MLRIKMGVIEVTETLVVTTTRQNSMAKRSAGGLTRGEEICVCMGIMHAVILFFAVNFMPRESAYEFSKTGGKGEKNLAVLHVGDSIRVERKIIRTSSYLWGGNKESR